MSILKKQSVAWVITAVMIVAAIIIGTARANIMIGPTPEPDLAPDASFYIYDDANVLSSVQERDLSKLNEELFANTGAVVACVTTNYGREDLYGFAIDYAEDIGLSGCDFIVVLDISGDNYWLVQGADLVDVFTDDDCGDYAWNYMEADFARGEYGDGLINLVKALYDWYQGLLLPVTGG